MSRRLLSQAPLSRQRPATERTRAAKRRRRTCERTERSPSARASAVGLVVEARSSRRRARGIDAHSSARWFDGWRAGVPGCDATAPTAPPHTWLARSGWRRHSLIDVDEAPRATRTRGSFSSTWFRPVLSCSRAPREGGRSRQWRDADAGVMACVVVRGHACCVSTFATSPRSIETLCINRESEATSRGRGPSIHPPIAADVNGTPEHVPLMQMTVAAIALTARARRPTSCAP